MIINQFVEPEVKLQRCDEQWRGGWVGCTRSGVSDSENAEILILLNIKRCLKQ